MKSQRPNEECGLSSPRAETGMRWQGSNDNQTVPCTAPEGRCWPKRSRLLCGARECGKIPCLCSWPGLKGLKRTVFEFY